MPGKKKKAKGKGKGKGGGLPPPPDLAASRQGALEALLKFRINDKEDQIEQCEEEGETFKAKNHQLKEKNHYLKIQRGENYKYLVTQAKEHEESLEKSPKVEKGSVEQAVAEKMHLAQKQKDDIKRCEEQIASVEAELRIVSVELEKWTDFRDVVQHANAAKIASMKEIAKKMLEEEAGLDDQYESQLTEAKIAIEARAAVLTEREKEHVSEHFLTNMDEYTKAELSDNAWLKQEIATAKESMNKLAAVVNSLEHRNIKAIGMVTGERTAELENTRSIYLATNRKNPAVGEGLKQAGDSGLPSLVNIAHCTSEKGPGGQAGQLELKLLSLQGSKATVIPPPEVFHLPPLDQQINSQNTIPSRSTWPVTHSMLKSVVK